ncbi:hypothetical protein Q6A90_05000 [Aliarcobacter skirrowii]|jgi:hypothetical protein|uniref:Uncharacterized protein n=1 Tax=Aliarcobacter skirrowii TaxID=28200 RepID=A0AAW9DAH5_9BACT|nr:hypothetical protein [Aliarcobacter skirrowii]MDX4061720.1 hypothetical protein [Aliarcobacter skirrowii]MDX4069122.1 hypothetical protein [Aliarcobacter skirrowii]HAC70122.1 hypothetical protein [Aliarcobacter skirrowii]
MTEQEAENKIKSFIPSSIKQTTIEVVKRESISRLEHTSTFAIIFKHTKENALLMVDVAKKLALSEPKLKFDGSEVDEKFNIEHTAVFITATIK